MSGFIASGNNEPVIITNDGWFPDIDADHLQATLRLDGSITPARLEAATINAILSVNRELAQYKADHIEYQNLEAVPAPQINNESSLIAHYRRAVYCTAGAEFTERYRSYDSSGEGHDNADQLTPSIDELRRDARWAISDILGLLRSTVELI